MKVLVLGELIIDEYSWGECHKISPEAPVAIANIQREELRAGGAANVIANLLAIGTEVFSIGINCGDQKIIEEILFKFGKCNFKYIDANLKNYPKKQRILSSSQQLLRIDRNDLFKLNKESMKSYINKALELANKVDLIIFSDYDKGLITKELVKKIVSFKEKKLIPIFVDTKRINGEIFNGVTAMTPNLPEAKRLISDTQNDLDVEKICKLVKEKFNLDYGIVTLGDKGVVLSDENGISKIPADKCQVYDVTGAGDTLLAVLSASYLETNNIFSSLQLAVIEATNTVKSIGTVVPNYKLAKTKTKIKIKNNFKSYKSLLLDWKRNNKKIGFTNGCFDILHSGHIDYLIKAKNEVDILIVGINNDDSVKINKGIERPFRTLEDRKFLLENLKPVDLVIPFKEKTPINLIKEINPDLLIKGGDYKVDQIIGTEYAKNVITIDITFEISTTKIAKKIRDSLK